MLLPGTGGRAELRLAWHDAWQRHRRGLPLEPLQAGLVDVIAEHPEYQAVLETGEALDRDWPVEGGEANPFLHLAFHFAVREGVATDRPPGIRDLHGRLLAQLASRHDAEHALVECLAETLWEAGRAGLPPRDEEYLEKVRRLVTRR